MYTVYLQHLIMGNAGFISSTVARARVRRPGLVARWALEELGNEDAEVPPGVFK